MAWVIRGAISESLAMEWSEAARLDWLELDI
jgi:hypothetical protein